MANLVKAEFHCHTCYSKDSLVPIERLAEECRKKGIQRLVITDHNTIEGAKLACKLNHELFIMGEEIMTQEGELLAIYITQPVPAGLPAADTIDLLRSQNAFIAVAHPFDSARSGHWSLENLIKVLTKIDAIEVFNSRCIVRTANDQAMEFANQQQVPMIVGSDSHTLGEIGSSTLRLPEFYDAESLRSALKDAEMNTRMSSLWVHFQSSYARWQKRKMQTKQP